MQFYLDGVGPGDPELLTLKAARLIETARVVAYPAPKGGTSFAREIAAAFVPEGAEEIEAGVVVLATGFELFDPKSIARYGYGRLPDVVSALEFERMCHAGGCSASRRTARGRSCTGSTAPPTRCGSPRTAGTSPWTMTTV